MKDDPRNEEELTSMCRVDGLERGMLAAVVVAMTMIMVAKQEGW